MHKCLCKIYTIFQSSKCYSVLDLCFRDPGQSRHSNEAYLLPNFLYKCLPSLLYGSFLVPLSTPISLSNCTMFPVEERRLAFAAALDVMRFAKALKATHSLCATYPGTFLQRGCFSNIVSFCRFLSPSPSSAADRTSFLRSLFCSTSQDIFMY